MFCWYGIDHIGTLLELERCIEQELDITDRPELSLSDTGQTVKRIDQAIVKLEQDRDSMMARTWSSKSDLQKIERQIKDARSARERYRTMLD